MATIEIPDELFLSVQELAGRLQISEGVCITRVLEVGTHTLKCSNPTRILTETEKEIIRSLFGSKTCAEIATEIGLRRKDIKTAWMTLVTAYIKAHWEMQSDPEMAGVVKWHMQGISKARGRLGLYRPDAGHSLDPSNPSVSEKIDPIEARELLLNGGKTMVDLISYYGLAITRERMRQICHERGCWVDPPDRTAKWYAVRYKNPDLGDRQKLCELIQVHKSLNGLSSKLTIDYRVFERVLVIHKIPFPPRKVGERATLVCSNPACAKPIVRWQGVVRSTGVKHPSCSHACRRIVFRLFPGWPKGKPRGKKK